MCATLVGGDGRRGMTAILGWYPTSVALYRILAGVGGSNTVNVVFLLFTLSPPLFTKTHADHVYNVTGTLLDGGARL